MILGTGTHTHTLKPTLLHCNPEVLQRNMTEMVFILFLVFHPFIFQLIFHCLIFDLLTKIPKVQPTVKATLKETYV